MSLPIPTSVVSDAQSRWRKTTIINSQCLPFITCKLHSSLYRIFISLYSGQMDIQIIFASLTMSKSLIQDPINNIKLSAEEKRKRRTRNDEEGRNFTCQCGKAYLSYPALYTHIKTKHSGNAQSIHIMHTYDHQHRSKEKQHLTDASKEEANTIAIFKKFLSNFFPVSHKERELVQQTLCRGFEDLQVEDLAFLKKGQEYWEKHKKEEEARENQTYATTIDNVLVRFLLQFTNDTSRNCQHYLTEFVIDLRKAINTLKQNEDYSSATGASALPTIFNDIHTQMQEETEGDIYLRYPTLLCKAMLHLGVWMFHERFTNYSTRFNSI